MSVAVRKPGIEKFDKVSQFMYTVHNSVGESLTVYIVVSKRNFTPEKSLFVRDLKEYDKFVVFLVYNTALFELKIWPKLC